MYEKKKPIPKKKMIELIIVICILLWVLFFVINYVRYTTSDKPPLFALPMPASKCDDGTVKEYVALGYVYRKYNSTSTNYTEFVPFWKGRKKCEESDGLPIVPKEYDVPGNSSRKTSYRGLAYFYINRSKLVGAYPCMNTEDKCDVAKSGYDEYNITDADELFKKDPKPYMNVVFERFGFVDDSIPQKKESGDKQYVRTVYYFDLEEKKILYVFGDVKYSRVTEEYNYGLGDPKNRYIVKDYYSHKPKWGLIELKEDGTYEEVLKFEYDSINYDEDTGYYIIYKDRKWSVYDVDKKEYIVKELDDTIYDIWQNGNLTYYYKIGEIYDTEPAFKILNVNGQYLLNKEYIVNILPTKRFVMYVTSNDKKIHFMDYTGEEKGTPIQLYFLSLYSDSKTHPAFSYHLADDDRGINIKVYKGPEYKYEYESYSEFISTWN